MLLSAVAVWDSANGTRSSQDAGRPVIQAGREQRARDERPALAQKIHTDMVPAGPVALKIIKDANEQAAEQSVKIALEVSLRLL